MTIKVGDKVRHKHYVSRKGGRVGKVKKFYAGDSVNRPYYTVNFNHEVLDVEPHEIEKIHEDAVAVNNVGGGQIASVGIGVDGEPPRRKTRRRSELVKRLSKPHRKIVEQVLQFKKKTGGKLSMFPSVHKYFNGAHNAAYGEDVQDHFIHAHDLHHYVKAEKALQDQPHKFDQGYAHGVAHSRWSEIGGKQPKSPHVGHMFDEMSHYYGAGSDESGPHHFTSKVTEPHEEKVDHYMRKHYKAYHHDDDGENDFH